MGDIEREITGLMEEQGMSQAELSRRSGVPKSSLSRYLSGDEIPASKLKKIAEALGVTSDRLLGIDAALPVFPLSPLETELVNMFANLDERDQNRMMAILRAMVDE